jgi:CO dehydrogenase/acetyl-CoA synthase beta subunit
MVRKLIEKAKSIYEKRDARLAGMVDENVEEFYSCTLCQSFAPTHVCVITLKEEVLAVHIAGLMEKLIIK